MTPPPVPLQVTSRLAQTLPTGLSFKQTYVKEAWHAAMTTGIPPGYFVRQIRQESGFNPNAVSPAGAIGIAQFMPQTAAGLGINPYEPVQSLQGAANLMARYQKFYSGDYAKALAAYNAGEGTLQAAISAALQAANGSSWRVFLPRETQHYITAIMEG
jgi:soluble lytic murein transglycosylase-like protein